METTQTVHQLKTEGISQFAYLVESGKEALLIDPLRDVEQYTKLLENRGLKLRYVYMTHMHADFVAGHAALAKQTGATILIGRKSVYKGKFHGLKDGEVVNLGSLKLRALETPGHTMDSTCLVLEEVGKQTVFTGDTLFLGEVGRPDLSVDPAITPKDLANFLFDSLAKLKTLRNDCVVYPGHGAGSACGKNICSGDKSTIGEQLNTNNSFKETDRKAFIAAVTGNLPRAPEYFFHDVHLNTLEGTESSQQVLQGKKRLTFEEFQSVAKSNIRIIDCRPIPEYVKARIPGSFCFPIKGKFETLISFFIKPKEDILLVAAPEVEREALIRLANIGYDSVIGHLDGGFVAWKGPTEALSIISVADFAQKKLAEDESPLDVRGKAETARCIEGSAFLPAHEVEANFASLDKTKTYFVYCQTGGRAANSTRILNDKGFKAVSILPGFDDLIKTNVKIVDHKN